MVEGRRTPLKLFIISFRSIVFNFRWFSANHRHDNFIQGNFSRRTDNKIEISIHTNLNYYFPRYYLAIIIDLKHLEHNESPRYIYRLSARERKLRVSKHYKFILMDRIKNNTLLGPMIKLNAHLREEDRTKRAFKIANLHLSHLLFFHEIYILPELGAYERISQASGWEPSFPVTCLLYRDRKKKTNLMKNNGFIYRI